MAQWVKELALSLLWLRSLPWCGFDPSLDTSACCRCAAKKNCKDQILEQEVPLRALITRNLQGF